MKKAVISMMMLTILITIVLVIIFILTSHTISDWLLKAIFGF